MKRALITCVLPLIFLASTAAKPSATSDAAGPIVTVYKDPSCGCCKKWVEYLRKNGYRVDVRDTQQIDDVKKNLGVPTALVSCHTAVINGYIIEGHVPVEDIARLLKAKPKLAGLAAPGMPPGSPGMEGPPPAHYQVVAFTRSGKTTVYANH